MRTCSYFLVFLLILNGNLLSAQESNDLSIEAQLDSLTDNIPGLMDQVDFTIVEGPIQELLRAVAETHDLNISLNNLPLITITNNFTNVTVKDLLVYLCQEYQLNIRFTNNIFTFYQEQEQQEEVAMVRYDEVNQSMSLDVRGQSLQVLIREITQKTPYNVVAGQQIMNQQVSGFIRSLPIEVALQNFGESNNLNLIKKDDDIFVFESMIPINQPEQPVRYTQRTARNQGFDLQTFYLGGEPYLSLQCTQARTVDLIRSACEELEISYMLLSEPQGIMDSHMDTVRFRDFLNIALETSNLSYSVDPSNVYLIGSHQAGSLSQSTVYSFKNRSVEGVEEVIPASLLQQAQIKLFKDLNAIIVTGSDRSTDRIISFLEQIDRAVPNVLIEVIVTEVNKGAAVRTGVQAFLSDSVPNTSGQIFGGVDVTVSSESFNRFLNNLDSRGILNLGRVTPNFYATIQAMEENNNLNIRSTPKLSTLNGHEATLTIGQSVFYLVETQNVTGGVNPIVTVTPRYEKVEANLDLKISPFVSDHEDVTLTIEAEFSDFIAPNVEGAPPGNATRKFISKIRVKNEDMVVMGGLEEVSKSESGSGVPFLSRVPILKWFFSSKTEENQNNKLLIFIRPTIVY